MKNQLEYSSQPAFNPSAYQPDVPPPYSDLNQQMPQSLQQQMPQPIQQVPQPIQQVPQPIQQMPQPLQQVPQPIQQMSQPLQQMPQTFQQMPQPIQQVSQTFQQMPQPCVNITMNNQSQQVQHVLAPSYSYLGKSSARMTCPHCHAEIMTKVSTRCTKKQHAIALLLFVSGFFTAGFCMLYSCLPYCYGDCGYRHSCPRCRMHIGSYYP
ncbi:uncharacterized protein LOC135834085 [Planococcus citri]|uniref:uncharacterized protein LOC135834085 n=1 Tax=Planococcus citri TaxID=170843 RepID=UPI0031F9618C